MTDSNKKLVVLTGPTAVGKTALSIQLAKIINGEIISADSIAVYKHFDIGSAKITKNEMQGIQHHLIDVMEPKEDFNVARFKMLADEAIASIYERGHIPIITGGTGFYIQAVLNDIDFTNNEENGYRKELEMLCEQKGNLCLFEMLQKIDPESARAIHPNNVKRVIRALEFYNQTGMKISEHNAREKTKKSAYNSAYFVLNCERNVLYERIEKRIDEMIEQGLVNEVRALVDEYGVTAEDVSMQGLGYKEILEYLNGSLTLDEAVYKIKRDTRHFAKRQLTWFKREPEVLWVDKDKLATQKKQLDYILSVLNERHII